MKTHATCRAPDVVVQVGLRKVVLLPAQPSKITLKKILLPVDFSELSGKALGYAVSFAKQFKAEILLLNVIEPVPPVPDVTVLPLPSLLPEMEESARKRLSVWRRKIGVLIATRTAVRHGAPAQEIVRAARENNVDLIIVGTNGRTGVAHFVMGSIAERVVQYAPCPVLVVREGEQDFIASLEAKDRATSGRTEPQEFA